jgi:hypothetical protein
MIRFAVGSRLTASRFRHLSWLPLSVVLLTAGWIASPTAQAAPTCKFTAFPDQPERVGETFSKHQVVLKHHVAVSATCGPVSSSSPDNSWVYAAEQVTTTQHLRGFGLGDTGFGLEHDNQCTFNPLTLDCPIPLGYDDASSTYSSAVDLFYSKPLQCARAATSVHVALTLMDPNSSATETVQGTPQGPCAGALGIQGVPKRCVTGTFKVRERLPHSLLKLLVGAFADAGVVLDVLKFGPRGPRPVNVANLMSPVGQSLENGAAITIFAGKLKPGRYELHMSDLDFDPSDYPNVFAKFRRCG